MSRRKLPLESPHWWPILEALGHRSQRTGSDTLATQDLNSALRAGRLRALVRHADGRRELLAASSWDNDLRITGFIRVAPRAQRSQSLLQPGGWDVFSRTLGKQPPGQWFFVWLPDYKNIFGDPHANSASPAQAPEAPAKRGRKIVHPWPEIGFELVRRLEKLGKSAGNKSTNSLAVELWEWCERRYEKAPVDSELRNFIDEVFGALRIERK